MVFSMHAFSRGSLELMNTQCPMARILAPKLHLDIRQEASERYVLATTNDHATLHRTTSAQDADVSEDPK